MNEILTKILNWVTSTYGKLTPNQRVLLAIFAGVVVLSSIAGVVVMKHDPYKTLFTDLQSEDSKAVAKKLGEQNIPYTVTDDHTTIAVPESQVAAARMQLAKEGLPGTSVVGFEKFDTSTLGMSSYVQRIQYIRAVQGELTRSIERLASVKAARVHISIPPKKTFMEEQEPPKASVVLELKAGQAPSKAEVRGIAHLVASAVEGLKVNQVTIVDNTGSFLHRPEDDSSSAGMSDALLEMQRSIESEYERRVEDILTPVVGFGKVKAKVTVEIDPSRKNTTEESFDADKAVAKNTIKDTETNTGSRPNPIGIPGSRSNLPGAEAQNPAVPIATTSSEKVTENKSFAIPRKVEITDKPSGNIKRITVAVLVDGSYKEITGGTGKTFIPRADEELKRLQDLVANAVGFDGERRDTITVMSMPFSTTDLASDVDATQVAAPSWYSVDELGKHPLRTGLLVLALLVTLFTGFKLLKRGSSKNQESENGVAAFPRTVAELEAANRAGGLGIAGTYGAFAAGGPNGIGAGAGGMGANGMGVGPDGSPLSLSKGSTLFEDMEPLEKKQELELRKRIIERMEQTPKKGLRIVLDWMDEEAILNSEREAVLQEARA